jgi:flagellar assembly protein FliH
MGAIQTEDFELFDYPAVAAPHLPSWDAFGGTLNSGGSLAEDRREADSGADERPFAGETTTAAGESHAQALKQSFENGHRAGFEDGRAAERQACAAVAKAREAQQVEQSARLVETFNARTVHYFASVEREVVKLALAVAARILRRESQLDPLLLSSAVRAALGQLCSATSVRLRVPAPDLDLWKETIAHLPHLSIKPVLTADAEMSAGECVLESELGSADLGIASHLAGIERGLFDRAGDARSVPKVVPVREDMSE